MLRSAAGRAPQYARFLAVGLSGVVVNLGIFLLALGVLGGAAGLAFVASTIAFAGAVSWNFVWNYLWTFRGNHRRGLGFHFGAYFAFSLIGLGMNEAVLFLAVRAGTSALLAQGIGILVGSLGNYGFNAVFNFSTPAADLVVEAPAPLEN
jgi:dolichol-phosphate mannosyltransferase